MPTTTTPTNQRPKRPETCSSCFYWEPIRNSRENLQGRCLEDRPQVIFTGKFAENGQPITWTEFPKTSPGRWCGRHWPAANGDPDTYEAPGDGASSTKREGGR